MEVYMKLKPSVHMIRPMPVDNFNYMRVLGPAREKWKIELHGVTKCTAQNA